MKRFKRETFIIVGLAASLSIAPISCFGAASIFSGIAEYGWFERFASSRAAGLARAGLALNDSVSLNFLNPAALGGIGKTRMSAGGYISSHRMRDHQASDGEDWAQFEYFGVAIALKKGLGLGLMLTPSSRYDYRYVWEVEISGENLTQSRQGSGGLSRAALNLGWAFSRWGKIGGGLSVLWGEVEESRISFTEASGYDPYIEFLNTKQWLAFGGSLGILLQPARTLTLGAVFEPEVPIQLDREFAYSEDDSTILTEEEYKLSALYGAGLSYRVTPQWVTSGQLIYSPWSQLALSDLPPTTSRYQDAYELAAGAEWTPGHWDSDFFFARLQYRFGVRWETGYVKSQNDAIDGYFASVGFGYPLHKGLDRFDISFEYGLQGDLSSNGGEEQILKFRLGLNLGETWFVRPKPSWED